MKLSNPHIHSFIIKIFLDEDAEASDRAIWHGYITHVPDGEQKYLKDLGDALVFIKSYLQDRSKKLELFQQVKQWIKRVLPLPKKKPD
jgi:hypothetical protein